jgi:hypothetical protein
MRTLLSLLLFGSALFAQLSVTAVSPARNARGVSAASHVTLTFSVAVNAATATPQNIRIFGRHSGLVPGTLTTAGAAVTFTPSRPYFASEWVDVYVSRNVLSTGGAMLTGGFTSTFHVDSAASGGLYPLAQTINFRLPGEGPIRTYGVYMGDIDRDGSPDITAANEVSFDVRLLKNDGCGVYGPSTTTDLPNGVEPSPNEGGDLNGDGWIDYVTGNQNNQSIGVYLNDGAGNYLTPVIYTVGGQVHGIGLIDVDSDGDLDVIAPNFSNVALLLNGGAGTFGPASFVNGGGSGEWCVAVGDANNDGKADIYCGNFSSNSVGVLLGNGAGGFTSAVSYACGGNPWAIDVADLDGDGNMDVVIAANGQASANVLRGNGIGGLLAPVAYAVGWAPDWIDLGDIDGDDDVDLCCSSFSSATATIWRNDGTGLFNSSFTLAANQAASSVVVVDYDRDGDSDIIVTDELTDEAFIYRQTGPAPVGVQPPSCEAAMRVNSQAARAGFGGRPMHPLAAGSTAFVNVSGEASQPFLLAAGVQQEPGFALLSAGLVNLGLSPFPILVVDGFAGNPLGVTNGFGEAWFAFPIPTGLSGSSLTLQTLMAAPSVSGGLLMSNPETGLFL